MTDFLEGVEHLLAHDDPKHIDTVRAFLPLKAARASCRQLGWYALKPKPGIGIMDDAERVAAILKRLEVALRGGRVWGSRAFAVMVLCWFEGTEAFVEFGEETEPLDVCPHHNGRLDRFEALNKAKAGVAFFLERLHDGWEEPSDGPDFGPRTLKGGVRSTNQTTAYQDVSSFFYTIERNLIESRANWEVFEHLWKASG